MWCAVKKLLTHSPKGAKSPRRIANKCNLTSKSNHSRLIPISFWARVKKLHIVSFCIVVTLRENNSFYWQISCTTFKQSFPKQAEESILKPHRWHSSREPVEWFDLGASASLPASRVSRGSHWNADTLPSLFVGNLEYQSENNTTVNSYTYI